MFLPSRRQFIAGSAAAVAAGFIQPAAAALAGPAPRRVIRFAHATDMHVQPELRGAEGWAAMLRNMRGLEDPVQMLITGGDLIMDAARTPLVQARAQAQLFIDVLREHVPPSMPVQHLIGNHDIFGRVSDKTDMTGDEPEYHRGWFLSAFGYTRSYRSFIIDNWKFILLDSMHLGAPDYTMRLDPQQRDWLEQELASAAPGMHCCIVSHAPILSTIALIERQAAITDDGFTLGSRRIHMDGRELESLFQKSGIVRLCLSGHLHQLDRTWFNGITYICDGAVSGDKWNGPRNQTPEGYGVIDLFEDGSFRHHYQTFGWSA